MATGGIPMEVTTSKEILAFANEVFDFVWGNQKLRVISREHEYLTDLGARFLLEAPIEITHFTEAIGRAVRVSQFLLRDHFRQLLKFTFSPNTFKIEVKNMWLNWLENRSNIFVKVIDTFAIIAEVIVYCEVFKNFTIPLERGALWFRECFEENLAVEFFQSGSWRQLDIVSKEWYERLVTFLDNRIGIFGDRARSKDQMVYDCELIRFLRLSPVMFPVPASAICNGCREVNDENLLHSYVYFRVESEYLEIKSSADKLRDTDPEEQVRKYAKTLSPSPPKPSLKSLLRSPKRSPKPTLKALLNSPPRSPPKSPSDSSPSPPSPPRTPPKSLIGKKHVPSSGFSPTKRELMPIVEELKSVDSKGVPILVEPFVPIVPTIIISTPLPEYNTFEEFSTALQEAGELKKYYLLSEKYSYSMSVLQQEIEDKISTVSLKSFVKQKKEEPSDVKFVESPRNPNTIVLLQHEASSHFIGMPTEEKMSSEESDEKMNSASEEEDREIFV